MEDLVGKIIDFETGNLDSDEIIDLFAHLVKTGKAWTLQGAYGRIATSLVEDGYISREGEVVRYPREVE